jgi:putative hydroxymethylpyrimidine transporter CytX
MKNEKTSVFSNGLIWFGAGVSIAEILTGMLAAPLGFKNGVLAILLGHFIGGVLMYFAGIIGALTEKSSMETVKIAFGRKGSLLFSLLNVLQLVGWTAVMIVSGASAASTVAGIGSYRIWSIIIGIIIIIWILIGIKNLKKINLTAMTGLFILSVILSIVIFRSSTVTGIIGTISFGSVVELSVAMSLSWLPLISDYTRYTGEKQKATIVSVVVYAAVSSWMFIIGMGAVIFTGETDIAGIMIKAGLGIAGLLIIVLSTVTTTFLDVYSAGVSSVSVSDKIKENSAAIIVCIIGTLLAVFISTAQFEDFLYMIGSVFSPMISILIVDFFILKKDCSENDFNWINLSVWTIGFVIYRLFMFINTPVGSTLPVMIITGLICYIVQIVFGGEKKC